jgi:hypothetical protein
MRSLVDNYRAYLSHRSYITALFSSLCILAISLGVNYTAGVYATRNMSHHVTDIILDNIPVYNVDAFFVYGTILGIGFITLLLLSRLQDTPFVVKSIALFVLIRSVFITLTHIAPSPDQVILRHSDIVSYLTFQGDLFFSGHTGMPFLLALIYWDKKIFRYTFLAASVIFAAVVLMGHLHYSIDVFAAYFISYTIFHIAQYIFQQDYQWFRFGIKNEKDTVIYKRQLQSV